MSAPKVTLDQLAAELGVTKPTAWKIANGLGIQPTKRRLPELAHRQAVLLWTRAQVERIKRQRRANGFPVPESGE